MRERRQKLVLEPVGRFRLVLRDGERRHVVRDDDDAVDATLFVEDRLVDQVEVDVLRVAARPAIQPHVHRLTDVWLAAQAHAVEQLVDALAGQLRQSLANRFPDQIAAADDLDVLPVGQLVDVIRSAQHRNRDGRVREEADHTLGVAPLDRSGARLEQLRIDARQQVARREGLHEIVVGRRGQPLETRLFARARRQHHHRHGCAAPRSARSSLSSPKPSSSGIITSVTMTSGRRARAAASASLPLPTASTVHRCDSSRRA